MQAISRVCMRSILLIVSNPVEAMTYVAWKLRNIFWIYNVIRVKNRSSHHKAWLKRCEKWFSCWESYWCWNNCWFSAIQIIDCKEDWRTSWVNYWYVAYRLRLIKWSQLWSCLCLGMVIGGHGEFILPVWSSVTVCGGKNSEPLKKLMDDYPEKLKLHGMKIFQSSQFGKFGNFLIWRT